MDDSSATHTKQLLLTTGLPAPPALGHRRNCQPRRRGWPRRRPRRLPTWRRRQRLLPPSCCVRRCGRWLVAGRVPGWAQAAKRVKLLEDDGTATLLHLSYWQEEAKKEYDALLGVKRSLEEVRCMLLTLP